MSDLERNEGPLTCPYCGDTTPTLMRIDTGMKLRLQESGGPTPAPDAVCAGCFSVLGKEISKGAALRAEAKAKEQNRLMLWKNRVGLVKQAKQYLAQKAFSDAAVAYEKYIRVLEIVYECKAGELSPDLFKNQARAQEITVIASVYWDLMRIYDTHPRYQDRQMKAAEKLAAFIRFSPIFPQIIRKAESQTRTAKNPDAFRRFLKLSHASRPRCFIATAAFDGERTETVDALCLFRDRYLKKTKLGRRAVTLYYRVSPGIAEFLDRHPGLKPTIRTVLRWVASRRPILKRIKETT